MGTPVFKLPSLPTPSAETGAGALSAEMREKYGNSVIIDAPRECLTCGVVKSAGEFYTCNKAGNRRRSCKMCFCQALKKTRGDKATIRKREPTNEHGKRIVRSLGHIKPAVSGETVRQWKTRVA